MNKIIRIKKKDSIFEITPEGLNELRRAGVQMAILAIAAHIIQQTNQDVIITEKQDEDYI